MDILPVAVPTWQYQNYIMSPAYSRLARCSSDARTQNMPITSPSWGAGRISFQIKGRLCLAFVHTAPESEYE